MPGGNIMIHVITGSIDRKGMVICSALLVVYAGVIFSTATVPWLSAAFTFAQILISSAFTWLIVGVFALGTLTVIELMKGSDRSPQQLIIARLGQRWKA